MSEGPVEQPDRAEQVRRLLQDGWAAGNEDVMHELVHEDFRLQPMTGQEEVQGKDGLKELWERQRSAMPDLDVTVEDVIQQGDRVVARWSAKGTHQEQMYDESPTGNSVSMSGTTIMRFDQDKVVEASTHGDPVTIMGAIKPDLVVEEWASTQPAMLQDT